MDIIPIIYILIFKADNFFQTLCNMSTSISSD